MSAYIDVPALSADGIDFGGHAARLDAKTVAALAPKLCKTTQIVKARMDNLLRRAADEHYLDDYSQERADGVTDFVSSELELMLGEGETIERGMDDEFLFVPGRGTPLLQNRTTLRNGIREASYKVRASTGQAQWMAPEDTRSLQKAGYQYEKKRFSAEYYGIRWGWTIPELWEAGITGDNVQGMRQQAATYALDMFREAVSSWGDLEHNIQGYFSLGDSLYIDSGQQFSSGAVSAQDQIERLSHMDRLFRRANNDLAPTTVVMPLADQRAMMLTYFGTDGDGPSVWERATAMFPWLRNARTTDRLEDANRTGDASRWVLSRPEPQSLYVEHQETQIFGPFNYEMQVDFIAIRRHGGVINKRPERVAYIDFTP
jgi:hypothetical protein